jgi:hypothetical protein
LIMNRQDIIKKNCFTLKKVAYLVAALWLLPMLSHATHIVGGDMTYRFMEQVGQSNRYMFKLKIYYDCYPADGHIAIDSDSTITIAIYQQMTVSPELWRLTGNNNGNRMITVRRQPVVTIPNPVFECIVPPANICVYEGIYEFELLLKRIPMPYCISYQRCCRNQASIANMPTNEANMGSNYHVMLRRNWRIIRLRRSKIIRIRRFVSATRSITIMKQPI